MRKPLRRYAVGILLAGVIACVPCLSPCARQAQASELFGDAPGQPVQGEIQDVRPAEAVWDFVDSLSLLGLGLAVAPLAQPVSQIISTAAGAGSQDQDHGSAHGQGHGN